MLEKTRQRGPDTKTRRTRGLVSSRESGARIESRTFASRRMADVVDCFWIARWDLSADAPHNMEMLADPCVNIAFEQDCSRVVGVHTKLWRRQLAGNGFIRAAKLKAGAARAFLSQPIVQMTDRVIEISNLFSFVGDVENLMLCSDDDSAAIADFDAWLSTQRLPLDSNVALACQVVQRVADCTELSSAAALAKSCGMSLRALQRLFRDYVGASPKWVIRRYRLQEVAARLDNGQPCSLADLAAELGYADHAHLTRDFKAATGRSPSVFSRQ
jgi:AraC-like DNA-binding protein